MRCGSLGSGVVVCAVVLISVAAVQAWPIFKKHNRGTCDTEVVKLPGQQVVVETTRPQVTVQETRVVRQPARVGFAAAPLFAPAPVVATIFTPMALPIGPVGVSETREVFREERSSHLRALHDLEHQAVEVSRLRAAHKAEQEAISRAYNRLGAALRESSSTEPAKSGAEWDDVVKEIKKLSQRVDEIEKLVHIHDEVIKKKVLNVPAKPGE